MSRQPSGEGLIYGATTVAVAMFVYGAAYIGASMLSLTYQEALNAVVVGLSAVVYTEHLLGEG